MRTLTVELIPVSEAAYIEAFGLADAASRPNPPSALREMNVALDDLVA